MKWPTRALNLGVWGGFLPKFFVLIFGLSLDKICWLFHRPCIGLYRKQAKIIKAIPSQNVQVGTLKMQTGWDTGTPKMRTIWDTGTLKMQTKCWDTGTLKMQTGWDTGTSKMWKIKFSPYWQFFNYKAIRTKKYAVINRECILPSQFDLNEEKVFSKLT